MRKWFQKIFVYSYYFLIFVYSYYFLFVYYYCFFAFFRFVSTSFYLTELSLSFVVQLISCKCETKCVTLAILGKKPSKIDKYFPFAKSDLRKNSFMQLKHFLTFLLFVFIEK